MAKKHPFSKENITFLELSLLVYRPGNDNKIGLLHYQGTRNSEFHSMGAIADVYSVNDHLVFCDPFTSKPIAVFHDISGLKAYIQTTYDIELKEVYAEGEKTKEGCKDKEMQPAAKG